MRLKIFLLSLFFATHAFAIDGPIPAPPKIAGSSYYLMDFHSGQEIAAKNPHERLDPASITKLMTAYIAFNAISNGNLALDERVTVSDKAYKAEGSRMFIESRIPVTVEELLQGMIIQSGNDASIALAEHIAGSEETFAELMNQYAASLGLENTQYKNATGWPAEGHYSTSRDIAVLATSLIREFPQFYRWYSTREYTYNGITQHNRNTLLFQDDSVDGIKTGMTDAAGYCLAASAERDGTRLISVVMGTSSKKARAEASQKLLTYGFRFYETHALYSANTEITRATVWKGDRKEVPLGVREQIYVTIPSGRYDSLQAEMDLQSIIVAPLSSENEVGVLKVSLGDELIKSSSLYPLETVATGSLLSRAIDEVMLWFE